MKAKNFLSGKTVEVLKGLDLSSQAEKLRNLRENVSDDLPYWLLRLDTIECHSTILSIARSLGISLYSTGALFRSPSDNEILKSSYEEFIKANKFDLSREFACAIMGLKVSQLNVNKNDAYAITLAVRKLIHKAWVHSSWEGDTYESLDEFFASVKLTATEPDVMPVRAPGIEGSYCQYNNGLWYDAKMVSPISRLTTLNVPINEELDICAVGLGHLKTNAKKVPVFNRRQNDKDQLYVVGKNKKGAKHLIVFEDINVLAFHKKFHVESWKLVRLCNASSAFRYCLSGYSKELENPVIQCYGLAPFYTPSMVKA